jgi:hypothetical protein
MDRARKHELRVLNEKAWDGEKGTHTSPEPGTHLGHLR